MPHWGASTTARPAQGCLDKACRAMPLRLLCARRVGVPEQRATGPGFTRLVTLAHTRTALSVDKERSKLFVYRFESAFFTWKPMLANS